MGLLTVGTPLTWEETKKYADHVREHGILQFISIYKRLKERTNDSLYFGDEVEYTLVCLDDEKREARLSLKAQQYLQHIGQAAEAELPELAHTSWTHEYASYMIEGTPGKPYGALSAHFNVVEDNMKKRRQLVQSLLSEPGETILSITVFPRLGCEPFTRPVYRPNIDGASRSLFFPDEAINQGHPRFRTLTRNIRQRRGEKIVINVPIFRDENTPSPFTEDFSLLGDDGGEAARAALPDHIYMDAMGFGMGCSCLQMTFQACNITEARHLYDQLAPLTPVLMSLSAASPVYRGYLADIDHRWSVISASVDDRTFEERGLQPLKESRFRISKSRYDSIDCYISPEGSKYNDLELTYDAKSYKMLLDGGIDEILAKHVAHLFIRDPVSLFAEKIDLDDESDTDHFENIQSTNWQTLRFKPPPANSKIGWRVEFRPTECQLTDFENAAFTVFVVMLTRVILSYNLNLLIPISKVDEGVKRAQNRDAVLTEKFYFRREITTSCSPPQASEYVEKCMRSSQKCSANKGLKSEPELEYSLMTVDEIINGKGSEFPGLVPFIHDYLNNIEIDIETKCTIMVYLSFISKRASGALKTTARWIRDFVMVHPEYKRDSVVSESIAYDLLKQCDLISKRLISCPDLVPDKQSRTAEDIPAAVEKAEMRISKKGKMDGRAESPRDTV